MYEETKSCLARPCSVAGAKGAGRLFSHRKLRQASPVTVATYFAGTIYALSKKDTPGKGSRIGQGHVSGDMNGQL